MKPVLIAAAFAALLVTPALAEEAATAARPQPAAPAMKIVLPGAAEPSVSSTSAAQPAAAPRSDLKAAVGGHDCASRKAVYLTN